jgi:hypothetical protein
VPVSPALAEGLAQEVVKLYQEAERVLLERTANALAKGLDSPEWVEEKLAQIREYRDQVEEVIDSLSQAAQRGVEDSLAKAYRQGGLSALDDLLRTGRATAAKYGAIEWEPVPSRPWVIREPDGRVLHRFDSPDKAQAFIDNHPEYAGTAPEGPEPLAGLRALEALNKETLTNLEATSTRILRSSLDSYRSIVSDTASQVLLGTQTRRQACQEALDRFAKKGITGFVDARGRGWDLSSYTEMAMRTATGRAAVQGHIDRLQENGLDLVIVSDAPGECELCRPWEGKVLSSSAKDPDHPSLDQARAEGLFHCNCRHSVSLYQEGITKPYGVTADPEGDAARQKQRYLERQVRASKRMEAAALDDTAKAKAQARVKDYQEQLREHVGATGGKRLYYREQIGKAPAPKPVVPKAKTPTPRPTKSNEPGKARTIKEAEDFARSLGIPQVDYGKTHLRLANTVNEMLHAVKQKYGLLPKQKFRITSRVRGFGGAEGLNVPAAFVGELASRATEIAINPRATLWLDPAGFQAAAYAAGLASSSNRMAVLLHELAHQEHYFSDPDRYVNLHFTGGGYSLLVRLIGPQVSRYAATCPLEFVAETYAGLATGESYTRDVMDLYRKLGGPKP